MKNKGYKFYLEAELNPVKDTLAVRKEVASVLSLPDVSKRQPDLSYFSSIFVSTGTNLNNAHFLASELVMAEGTVAGKAVDIEHEEDQIIGHIYASAFTDKDGNHLNVEDLRKKEIAALDQDEMHIEIASVVYKARFPEIAKEVSENKWKVSMEAYFMDFDVMIGGTILSKDEAKALGFDAFAEANYGKSAKVVKGGEVVAEGNIAKVLRGICFSGVGIVKNPANPPSVVLEATASVDDQIIFDIDKLENSKNNNVTSHNKRGSAKIDEKNKKEVSELQYNDTVGVCVNYKKELTDSITKDQDSKILEKNWCSKFDRTCPVAGEATDPNCLRNSVTDNVVAMVNAKLDIVYKNNKIASLTNNLLNVLKKVNK